MKTTTLLYLTTLLFFLQISGQTKENKYSFVFNQKTIQEAIQEIESKTKITFYYYDNWADLKKPITMSFSNQTIDTIIKDLVENSNLNFFIENDKCIITQNNYIFSDLNFDLIQKDSVQIEKNEVPLFFEKLLDNKSDEKESVTFIGKQEKNNSKKKYILEGTITDIKTNVPIQNVVIEITDTNIKTVTDINGYFTIKVPDGINNIEIHTLTHRKLYKKIIIKKDAVLNFKMEENITILNEVIVEKVQNKEVKDVSSGVTSFNIEKSKNIPLVLGERDIIKIALALPGIKSAGEGSSGINVRGGKDDQNLFLLDNATIYNPSHFFGFFSSVNPYIVNDVNIYKGHIPAEFGGRIASVFEIRTKEGDYEKFKGEGGIGPVTSNITFTLPVLKQKSTLSFGARATYSKWILKEIKNEQIQKSDASFYDIFLKYKHKINLNNSIEFETYYSKDNFKISSDSLYNYSNRVISLNWKHKFNDKNTSRFQITNSDYQFGIDYNSNNLKSFNYNFKINESKLIVKNTYFYNEKHTFNYGLNSTLYNLKPGELNPLDENSLLVYKKLNSEKGLENAVFIYDEFELNKKISFNLGLRYTNYLSLGPSTQNVYQNGAPISIDNIQEIKSYKNNELIKSYNGLEYRFSARYMLNETSSIKAAYTTNNQYIHKLSSNTTQSPTDTWKLADLNIKPSQSKQYSIGYFKSFKEDIIQVSLEGYFKKTKNFLDFTVGSELILNNNIETESVQGEGKAYGAEFLIKKSTGKLNGWIGYTYSRSLIKLDGDTADKIINNGKYFASNFDKPHDFNLIANYKFTKRYSASLNFVYQTGRPVTIPTGTYTVGGAEYTLYSKRNEFRVPDYYRVDIGLNIEGNHKIKKPFHSFWNISIYNLLGRNNPYSIFFVTDDGRIKGYKTSIFANPIPTITYNFKF
jgi:hypothetical protein